MKRRCVWCNGTEGDLKEAVLTAVNRFGGNAQERTFLVHAEHEGAFAAFNDRVRRFGLLFLVLMGACLISTVAMEIIFWTTRPPYALLGMGISVFALGGLITFLPFSTPETVKLLGARRSIRLVRALGVLLAAGGVCIASLLIT